MVGIYLYLYLYIDIYTHTYERERERERDLSCLIRRLIKTLILQDQGPTFMTSFNLNNLL